MDKWAAVQCSSSISHRVLSRLLQGAMRRQAERLVSLQTFSQLDGSSTMLDGAAARRTLPALQCTKRRVACIDSRANRCRRRVDSTALARALKSSAEPRDCEIVLPGLHTSLHVADASLDIRALCGRIVLPRHIQ